MLSKHRIGIAPEIFTIRDTPSAIGIAALVSLRSLARSRTPASGGFNEGVDTQETRPLLDEAALLSMTVFSVSVATAVSVTVGVAVTSAARSCRRWAGSGKRRRVERSASGGEGAVEGGGGIVVDPVDVLVGGHRARDLDELDKEEHGDPGELEGGPDGG